MSVNLGILYEDGTALDPLRLSSYRNLDPRLRASKLSQNVLGMSMRLLVAKTRLKTGQKVLNYQHIFSTKRPRCLHGHLLTQTASRRYLHFQFLPVLPPSTNNLPAPPAWISQNDPGPSMVDHRDRWQGGSSVGDFYSRNQVK